MSDNSIWGSEWGYLDNTKHLIFWLCNIKQLNFRHFNTNSKTFSVSVHFIQKETKTAPNKAMLFCLVFQEVFGHFPTISDHGRFPKMSEDYWSFPTRNPKLVKPKKFRQMFLDGATLDCFERSRMTLLLCLSKAESSPLLQKLTKTLTTPEENSLDAAFGLDADQRIVGSWREIGTQYSPEYCCEWVEKRDYSYCPFEHGLKVHWWFEQSQKTTGFPRKTLQTQFFLRKQ